MGSQHPPPCFSSALPPCHLSLLFIAWQESRTPQPCDQLPSPHPVSCSRKGHSMRHHQVKNAFNGHICFGLNPRALVTRQLGAPGVHMAPALPSWRDAGDSRDLPGHRAAEGSSTGEPGPLHPTPRAGSQGANEPRTVGKLHPWERHQLVALAELSSPTPCAGAQQCECLILH